MANTYAPFGFRVHRHLAGGTPNRTREFDIDTANATNIMNGDAVVLTTSGAVNTAAAGNIIQGVFAGCRYENSAGEQVFSKYWPADTSVKTGTTPRALVYADPLLTFEVQTSSTTALTVANIGNLVDHTAATATNTDTGRSAQTVSAGGVGTTAAGFRILNLVDKPDNEWGAYQKLEVQIVEHRDLFSTTAGV